MFSLKKIPIIFYAITLPICISANQSEMIFSISGILNNNSFRNLKHHDQDILGSGVISEFGFIQGEFKIINQMLLSRHWGSIKKGGGKKIKGFYGYSNIGYIEYEAILGLLENKWRYGRSYLDHGFSQMSNLLISKDSRPFDGFFWKINYKDIQGSVNAIQLEKINNYERYLTIHSLQININNKLSLLFSESSLFSTENGGFNWQLLNPVIFWVPERENYPILKANGLLYFGLNYSFIEHSSIYSEFLIDDWQINKKSKGDLEPNEFGVILGLDIKDWLFKGFNFWAEYTKITNRTYQSYYFEEVYTHRGFPIGHYLGNDFDLIQVNISKEVAGHRIKPYMSIVFHRDGFNGMDTPFDEPWLADDVTLKKGFSEPFPTRPLVKKIESELAVDYNFNSHSIFNLGVRYKKNDLNIKPILEIVTRIKLGIGRSIKY